MGFPRQRAEVAAVCLIICGATLLPLGHVPPRFFWGFDWSDLLVNLCLYLPLGVVLASQEVSPLAIAALALGLSGAIELAQGLVISGRRGSPVDVATNFLGAMAGLAGYRGFLRLQVSRGRSMIAGAAALAALPVICWALTGPLLAPEPPVTPEWWGQWAHRFSETVPFKGTIQAMTLMGRVIPDGPSDKTAELIAAAKREPLSLEVSFTSGGSADGLTHLAGVSDGEGHVVISLEQLGSDLLLSWRSRGAGIGLRSPKFVFRDLLRGPAGTPLVVHAEVSETRANVVVHAGPDSVAGTQRLTPIAGWRNLIPARALSGKAQTWLDRAWALVLLAYLVLAIRVLRRLRVSY
jgi:hypothetical protein